MERRVELADGIEGLYLKPIAQARGKQRRGRTGRIGEGVYIDHCPSTDRPAYPVPEILRTRLDQTVLRLAVAGYDATELPFFHDLDHNVIVDAKRALRALGAMTEDGMVTKTGRLMAKLPVSVQYARMVVEAEERGVMDDVVTIAAILEAETLRDRTDAWRQHTNEKESDLLAELDLWQAARNMRNGEMRRDNGIFGKSYFRAKEIRDKLVSALKAHRVQFGSTGNREDILKACVAGMVDHLYKNEYGDYRNGGSGTRQKARESVVAGSPSWIVGLPKDIQFKNRRGYLCTLNLVSMVTKVDPAWLVEVAPQLVENKTGLNPRFDSAKDSVVSTTQVFFNGQLVKEETVQDSSHPEAPAVFARWLASQMV
jgi:ATP-dependent helicase HrpA